MSVSLVKSPTTPLRVVHVAAEVDPFFKTGQGLADVLGQIPQALAGMGVESTVYTPLFQDTKLALTDPTYQLSVIAGVGDLQTVSVFEQTVDGVVYKFIGHDFLSSGQPYGQMNDDQRFSLFALAVLQDMEENMKNPPHILEAHDWHAGLLPAYLKVVLPQNEYFAGVKTVFVVHDIAYQGNFPTERVPNLGFGWNIFVPKEIKFHEWISFLKAGMFYADKVVVRTERGLERYQTENGGKGFSGLIKELMSSQRLCAMLADGPDYIDYKQYAQRTLGLYRGLVGVPFIGMEASIPLIGSDESGYQVRTYLEVIEMVNPVVARLYGELEEDEQAEVDRFVNYGQAHIFEGIETLEELRTLVNEDLRAISDRLFQECERTISAHVATQGESSLLSGEIKLMEDIPDLEISDDLVAAGNERRKGLVRFVPASGLGTRWIKMVLDLNTEQMEEKYGLTLTGMAREVFDNGHKPNVLKGCYRVMRMGNRSFFQIKIDDWAESQEGLENKMPIYFLTAPGEPGEIIDDHFRELGFEVSSVDEERGRTHYIRESDGLELVAVEEQEDTYVPAFTTGGKLAMLSDGKRVQRLSSGHGVVFQSLFESGAIEHMQSSRATDLFMSNIDNLGGNAAGDEYAAILGSHDGRFTAEMVPPDQDNGGVGILRVKPGRTDWEAQLGEDWTLSRALQKRIKDETPPFNPVGYTFGLAPLSVAWEAGQLIGGGSDGLTMYVEEKDLGDLKWYQPQTLAGDASEKIPPQFISVSRGRFVPSKSPTYVHYLRYLDSLEE